MRISTCKGRAATPALFFTPFPALLLSVAHSPRAPPNLELDLVRVEKRDDKRTHSRQGGEGFKNLRHKRHLQEESIARTRESADTILPYGGGRLAPSSRSAGV